MTSKKRICLVRSAFDDTGGDRGIEAAARASVLLEEGFEVHLLYLGRPAPERKWNDLTGIWRDRGLTIHALPDPLPSESSARTRSFAVHGWLTNQSFDLVDFDDEGGVAFYAALARKQGLAHNKTKLSIVSSSPSESRSDEAEVFIDSTGLLEKAHLERKALGLVDLLFFDCERNAATARKFETARIRVAPPPARLWKRPERALASAVSEIVFLGDQTAENGIWEFVDAAQAVVEECCANFTFIGRFAKVGQQHSGELIVTALAKYDRRINFLADLSRADTIEYLCRSDVLVVLPYRTTRAPCNLIEVAALGSKIIASRIDSHAALLDPSSAGSSLILPQGEILGRAILGAMRGPAPDARLRFDVARNNTAFAAYIDEVLAEVEPAHDERAPPFVSVCLVHFKRISLLEQCISALSRQTCQDFELILVDDGGQDDAAEHRLVEILSTCPFAYKIIRTDNIWIGAARNRAAAAASGEYLIFVDDDNVPLPNMVDTMRKVARRRDLDIGTCLFHVHRGDQAPDITAKRTVDYLPTCGPGLVGLIENIFGDANAIIRKSCFEELGGFDPTPKVGAEDWDLFLRAYLAGRRMEVIAAPLFFYRLHASQLTARPHNEFRYYRRLIDRFLAAFSGNASQGDLHSDLESAVRLSVGREASDLTAAIMEARRRGLSYGLLLDALMRSLDRDEACETYILLGQLLCELQRPEEGAVLIARGIRAWPNDAAPIVPRNGLDERQGLLYPFPVPAILLGGMRQMGGPPQYVRYESDKSILLLHPVVLDQSDSRFTVASLPFPLTNECRGIGIKAAVLNAQGPEVKFVLAATDKPVLDSDDFPSEGDHASAVSRTIHPDDGWVNLDMAFDLQKAAKVFYVYVATEGLRNNSNAWAYVKDINLIYAR